jgi:hypothetical protein
MFKHYQIKKSIVNLFHIELEQSQFCRKKLYWSSSYIHIEV